ncbi:MAG TPA: peptidase E [Thermoleophilaceae bacterium]|nr:peptidase E [Thermoleophilaceae bacterium]
MRGVRRQIVALGGGGFSMEAGNPLLDDYVLGLTRRERPRVCFLPSASGDADHYIVRFYQAFSSERCEPSHVSLFRRGAGHDLREHLLAQDLIYVGGGSVVSLLGVWQAHGLDAVMREAWRAGVVLCGVSAGSLCWFAEGITGFHGPAGRFRGLGLLGCSNTVHYEAEPRREDAYRSALRNGMRPGYAAGDGAALHFVGERLLRAVSSRPGARAFRMRCVRGRVIKTRLRVTYLGDAEPHADTSPARLTAVPEPPPLTAAAG